MGVALRAVGVASCAEYLVVIYGLLYRMASATSLECVVIPTKPHQPLSFNFPTRSFGHEKEFSAKLVCKMAFLHYDQSKDAVFCHTCLMELTQFYS